MTFDWCIHDAHEDCPGYVEKFHYEKKTKANPTGLVITDETKCECECHECFS